MRMVHLKLVHVSRHKWPGGGVHETWAAPRRTRRGSPPSCSALRSASGPAFASGVQGLGSGVWGLGLRGEGLWFMVYG